MNTSQWISQSNSDWTVYSTSHDPLFLAQILKHPYSAPQDISAAFAYAVIHHHNQEIIAARDPFGLEPFYYFYNTNQFIFASKIPDILNTLQQQPQMNLNQMMDLFSKGLNGSSTYTDETYYQNIYRLEPGSMLQIKDGKIKKTIYWRLDPNADDLALKNDDTYLEYFSELIGEAMKPYRSHQQLAAEFSGGIDSSTIIVAAKKNGITPKLFSHIAPTHSQEQDDREYADSVMTHLQLKPYYAINAESFDPLKVFEYCAQHFAGGAPHLFYMLANNIHQAVRDHNSKILLSGFGGDECVSAHAPIRATLPQLMMQHRYQKAWHELTTAYTTSNQIPPNAIKRCILLLKTAHPSLYSIISQLESVDHRIACYLKLKNNTTHQRKKFYRSIRDYEYDLLQGARSHHLRMRIEYSAVIAKSMGFEYRYPLLHPKLVEFCFRLPIEQKRRNGMNRYLIRRYLAQFLPEKVYNKHQKIGSIMPATLQKCRDAYASGLWDSHFKNLPFTHFVDKNGNDFHGMIAKINAYMFGVYLNGKTDQ